jgi:IS5 family transposase
MFKALILQPQHDLSDAKMAFMIRDRLSWIRFRNFEFGATTPDENTIRLFRNKLTETGSLQRIMKAFGVQLQKQGYIPMSGRIAETALVPAPKQRNTCAEKGRGEGGHERSGDLAR